MKLTAYEITPGKSLELRPARRARAWIDEMPAKHAYRCLPLTFANQHGWEIIVPYSFVCRWNGSPSPHDVTIEAEPHCVPYPTGHFGGGVLTFHSGYLFRTDPGWNLFITGPLNTPKDGIAPLSAIVEADWGPWTSTINWRFTRPCEVEFEAGDAIAHFFPILRGLIESVETVKVPLSDNPELHDQYKNWERSRSNFNHQLKCPGSVAAEAKWQGDYYKGITPDGRNFEDHQYKPLASKF